MTIEGFLDSVHSKLSQYPLVLIPSTTAFQPLKDEVAALCDEQLTVSAYLEIPASTAHRSICVTDLESICTKTGGGGRAHPLGLVRAKTEELLAGGSRVAMLSRYPRIRYPRVPGSSVLEDAKVVHLPLLPDATGDPLGRFPGWQPGGDPIRWLLDVLSDLGLELAARLDEALFESPQPPRQALNALRSVELDALYFAGLIQPGTTEYEWSTAGLIRPLKEALSDFLASSVVPPSGLAEAYELLWGCERILRRAIRRAAIDKWGNGWKSDCLTSGVDAEVLKRAGEVAYKNVQKIGRIRDPLEWLTLSELLALRQDRAGDLGSLGLESSVWRRFSHEVLPIRHQVSHMRLIGPEDLDRLSRWHHLLLGSVTR